MIYVRFFFPVAIENRRLMISVGLPWWLSGEESICQCRRHRFGPQSKKISHATGQLSPDAPTTKPVLRSSGNRTTEPMSHNY